MEENKQLENNVSQPSAQNNQSQSSPTGKAGRIYINYKSKDAILAETSPQSTNLYEKSKRDRQQIEQLNQIALNRVQLLQLQDEKLNKKINEQKNQAMTLTQKLSRIEQEKLKKEQRKKEAEEQLMMKKQKAQQMKLDQKCKTEKAKQNAFGQKFSEALLVKQQSLENKSYINQFNKNYETNNQIKKNSIQQDYAEGNERIKEFYLKRKLEVQLQIKNMVLMEEDQKKELEQQYKLLEEEELKQLQKLKETQQTEQQIANQLETVKAISPSIQQKINNEFQEKSPESKEFSDPTLITNQVLLEKDKDEENNLKSDEINQ